MTQVSYSFLHFCVSQVASFFFLLSSATPPHTARTAQVVASPQASSLLPLLPLPHVMADSPQSELASTAYAMYVILSEFCRWETDRRHFDRILHNALYFLAICQFILPTTCRLSLNALSWQRFCITTTCLLYVR